MISLEWVKEYIDIEDEDLEKLAVKITKAGINIESVQTNHINHLVIGEIQKVENHPDSDHLHVLIVDTKKEKLQIVCGAPNVKVGLKVIVAEVGAILPGNFEIKKSKIRGIESNGMICALFELGLEEKTEENYNKGIHELDKDAPVGENPIKYLGLEDTLYELDIHKHRNNDCYYHIGFAYEIAAILNRKVTLPEDSFKEEKDSIENHFKLEVQTEKCPYYLARMVTDVEIKESPNFIKKRLQKAGMRSINNVVDISNYVMLEYGQPLHFFDKDKLGDKIVVRNAREKEKIQTLDGKERVLKESDIVITNGIKPVCIAGIMGGEETEVENNTKNILIESAIFDSVSTRYTANHLNLRSEASIRYGKGLNYEYTEKALQRACYLLSKYANAKILSGIIKHDKIDKTPKIIQFTPQEVNNLLGITISNEDMKYELERLDFPYEVVNDTFTVKIPSRRLDIDPNVNDIAEEIGRLYGYHNLISTLPKVEVKKGEYIGDVKYRKIISSRLRALGLNEAKTYTLVSNEMSKMFDYEGKQKVVLPNPMSADKMVIRTTLIPSLLNVYNYNKARHIKDIKLYEISKTYDKDYNEESKISGLLEGNYIKSSFHQSIKVDFYIVKGIVENILDYMGFKNRYTFKETKCNEIHKGICASIVLDGKEIGIMGRIHPSICKEEVYIFEMSLNAFMQKTKPLKYKEPSKYPSIHKDVAFIIPKQMKSEEIEKCIQKIGGRLLTNVEVFDVYEGEKVEEGKKSIAYALTFNNPNKTLEEKEVTEIFHKIIDGVIEKYKVQLRDE